MTPDIVEVSSLEDIYPFLIRVVDIMYIKPYRTGESGHLFISIINGSVSIHFKSMEETMRCYDFLKNNILQIEGRKTEFKEKHIEK